MLLSIFKFLFIIILLVCFVCVLYFTFLKKQINKRNGILSIIFIVFVLFLLLSLKMVQSNNVGVKYSIINGTSEKTLDEGAHFVIPFLEKIYSIDTTVQERTDKDVSVQTKDAQWVKMEVNVKYQVSKENAFKVYKGYKTLDNLNKNIIGNYAQDSLNKICSQYNVIDILGEKRNKIIEESTKDLKDKLSLEGVTLKSLTIKDVDAGEEIEKAISDEAVAKKQVETAKQNQEKAKTEAETKLIEAEGEAKANEVKTKQLTDEILIEQWIEKWDGKLPSVSGEDGLIVDINELLKDKGE